MKKIRDILLKMVYPMLGCLFIACFADAFMVGSDAYRSLSLAMYCLAIIFGIMFLVGFIWNIVYYIIHRDKE